MRWRPLLTRIVIASRRFHADFPDTIVTSRKLYKTRIMERLLEIKNLFTDKANDQKKMRETKHLISRINFNRVAF